jgi:hypothetical protein
MVQNQATKASAYKRATGTGLRINPNARAALKAAGTAAPAVSSTSSGSASSDGTPSNGATAGIAGQLQAVGLAKQGAGDPGPTTQAARDAAAQAAAEQAAREEAEEVARGADRIIAATMDRYAAAGLAQMQAEQRQAQQEKQQQADAPDPNAGAPNAPGGRGVGGLTPVRMVGQDAHGDGKQRKLFSAGVKLVRNALSAFAQAEGYMRTLIRWSMQAEHHKLDRQAAIAGRKFAPATVDAVPDMGEHDHKALTQQLADNNNFMLNHLEGMLDRQVELSRLAKVVTKVPDGLEGAMATVLHHEEIIAALRREIASLKQLLVELQTTQQKYQASFKTLTENVVKTSLVAQMAGAKTDDIAGVLHQVVNDAELSSSRWCTCRCGGCKTRRATS